MLSIGVLVAIALGVVYWDPFYEPPIVEGTMAPVAEGAIRVLTLNVAHGRGTAFNQILTRTKHIRRNLDAVAKLIRVSDADVVALQELDAASSWSGGFDHLAYLAEKTGYPYTWHGVHIDRKTPQLAYGTGLLSRHPISGGASRGFNRNKLDTKGFVWARIKAPALEFSVVSVHLDFKRDGERRAQLDMLSEFLEGKPGPLVVAGDFNSAVVDENGVLGAFAKRNSLRSVGGSLLTYPSHNPTKKLDDIFVGPALEPLTKRSLDVQVSDHRPLVMDLRRGSP